MEGMSEAYNETWRDSEEVKMFNRFLEKNKSVGTHFNQKIKDVNYNEDLSTDQNDFTNERSAANAGKSLFSGMSEMHRKRQASKLNKYLNYT